MNNQNGGVRISPNLIKKTMMVDINGNEIDPRTKQIIKPAKEPLSPEAKEAMQKSLGINQN